MTEIIKIEKNNFNGNLIETVNARQLWEKLEVNSKFADWFKNRINKYQFIENIDFVSVSKILENGGKSIEYFISIDMAKELCMVENNEQGRNIRKYFIECERIAKNATIIPQKIDSHFLQMITNQMAELERKIEQDKPKVEFYETVAESKDTIDIGEVAKVLKLPFGRNKLFEFLRNNGTLNDKNIPYQKFIDKKYFKVIETTYSAGGQNKIYLKTLVTQKGLEYLSKMFKTFALIGNDNN